MCGHFSKTSATSFQIPGKAIRPPRKASTATSAAYTDIGTSNGADQLLLVDSKGEHRIPCAGKVDFPFFGELILDCLHGTEKAMTQAHAFRAAELCLKSQNRAQRLPKSR